MQVILALANGEIIYFELTQTGQLLEVEKKDIAGGVACIDIAPIPEGRQRSRFLAVGSHDSTVSDLPSHPACLCKVPVSMLDAVASPFMWFLKTSLHNHCVEK